MSPSRSDVDAFDVLGLSARFDLDLKELETRYRDLLRALHPDKHVRGSGAERRESLSRAVSVNEAYRVLKDELKRAELVLARRGGAGDEKAQANDPQLLMEVMELREELSEARAARDRAAVSSLARKVEALAEQARATLGRALGHAATLQVAELEAASRALTRLRYYRRFGDEVAQFEDEELGG